MKTARAPGALQNLFSSWSEGVSLAQKLLILTLLFLLGTLLAGFFFIHTPWQQQRRLLMDQQQQEQDRSKLLTNLHLQSKQLEKQKEKLLTQGGVLVLISEVTRLAAKAGIRIDSVTPKTEATLGAFTKSQIQVEATSNLKNLLAFLHDLEQHEPLLRVDRLELGESLSSGRKETAYPTWPQQEETSVLPDTDRQKTVLWISAFSQRESPP